MPSNTIGEQYTVALVKGGELGLMNHGEDNYTLSVRVPGMTVIAHIVGDDVKALRDATGQAIMDNFIDALTRPAT